MDIVPQPKGEPDRLRSYTVGGLLVQGLGLGFRGWGLSGARAKHFGFLRSGLRLPQAREP